MMNVFARDIDESTNRRKAMRMNATSFARQLASAMGLGDSQIIAAEQEGISWRFGQYVVSADSHPWNGWKSMLEARPISMPDNHGYSNVESDGPLATWWYEAQGTATVICPPLPVQAEILESIRSAKEKP